MASVPEGDNSFDFALVQPRQFDHQDIANLVVWPLVSLYGPRDDWLATTWAGDEMQAGAKGVQFGQSLSVTIKARTDLHPSFDDPEYGACNLSQGAVEVELIVTDERRDWMVRAAERDVPDEDVGEDGEKMPAFDDVEDYVFKIATSYIFDTDGDLSVLHNQAVEDLGGDLVWDSIMGFVPDEGVEVTTFDDSKVHVETVIIGHDMEMLEAGLAVLNPPEEIVDAFEKIRDNPIT